jgi:hypothetical protein
MSHRSAGVLIADYTAARAGQRGIVAYAWLVGVLRSHAGSSDTVVSHESASGVLTLAGGAAVLHSLSGDPEHAAIVIEQARRVHPQCALRGLALPGDRQTKNLFEEARLPAQVLLH